MMTVAWRQHRVQLGSGALLLAVLAALLGWTGHEMTSYLHSSGLSACLASHSGCADLSGLFERRFGGLLRTDLPYLNFLPMLVGVFWGAPLVARELESGTYRLAWTQSITRRRWFLTKLAFFVVATAVAGGIFSLLLTWWLHPFGRLTFGDGFSRMDLNAFDFQGIVPIAYALFALAVGTAAGVFLRRTLPAMVATFAVYLPVRLKLQSLRAHFSAPLRISYPGLQTGPRNGMGDWVVSSHLVDHAGRAVSDRVVFQTCGIGPSASKVDVQSCIAGHGFRTIDLYQPASRFWTFQGIEFAVFVGLAVVLLAVSVLWVTRNATR